MAALVAADSVQVPLQLQVYAWDAMTTLENLIEIVRPVNKHLQIGGIACLMADSRTNLSAMVEEQARKSYSDLVYQTIIPSNVKVAEAPALGEPIHVYAPKSAGAVAFAALAAEIEERYPYAQ